MYPAQTGSRLGFVFSEGGNWASTRNRISAAYDDGVVEILSCVLEARADVVSLQVRIVGENLVFRLPGRKHFQNVLEPDSHVANARTAAALAGLDGDS